jgi:transketolase
MPDSDFRRELAQQSRVDSVHASAAAGLGDPTSSMSAAYIIAVLLNGHLTLDFQRPDDPRNDHLIFSKRHASPHGMLNAAGAITDDQLLTYRTFGSRLEGHPNPRIPPPDVATGSFGQGLPIKVGVALTGKKLDQLPCTPPALTPRPSPLQRGNYSASSPSPPRRDPADYWAGEPRW